MLDAHQLNIFLTAAETLNFTEAAQRLHMSQPSVSQHIRALEKHFGEELFIRQGRSMILSNAGRILIPLAQQFVKQSTRINEAMLSLKGHIKGRIRLGCNAISGKYVLPEFFYQFHEMYPEVSIYCQTDSCNTPNEALISSNLHFLFTNQDQDLDHCFEVHKLLKEEICLITPLDHHWACRKSVAIEEMIEEDFILPTEDSYIYRMVNTALASKNISLTQLNSFLTLSNTESIILSVKKGLGVSFSSKIISSMYSDIVSIPLKDLSIMLDLSIVRDKTQISTAARDAFWEFMITLDDKFEPNPPD